MKPAIEISRRTIASTVAELRAGGDRERVVLWLGGPAGGGRISIREQFTPLQYAEADYFRIPREGVAQLFAHLRAHCVMVVAQIHTHPEVAFHSPADDRWAIVRHVGALSLVLPRFCRDTTADSFLDDAAVFRINRAGKFASVPAHDVLRIE